MHRQRQMETLRREIEIGQRLQQHPNVVQWIDAVKKPRGSAEVAIVFELATGGDARQLLERGGASVQIDHLSRTGRACLCAKMLHVITTVVHGNCRSMSGYVIE